MQIFVRKGACWIKVRILLTNDDGIEAEGIARLARMAARFGEVWVVAPEHQCSAMSQRITLREELVVRKRSFPVSVAKAYSVSGTPADCVKVALAYLMPERPDYVFSGMNFGFNTGYDIAYSGTVAAAMEGLMNKIPSIAFSNEAVDCYEVSERYLFEITQQIIQKPHVPSEIWNVNFPGCRLDECRGILWDREIAHLQFFGDHFEERNGQNEITLSVRGIPKTKKDIPKGTDLAAVLDGFISVGKVKCSVLL